MINDTVNYLTSMRELLVQGWHQGSTGQDVSGRSISAMDGDAVSWCMIGAYLRADVDLDNKGLDRVFFLIVRKIGTDNVAHWNDEPGRTKEEVLAALDSIIADESGLA